MSAGFLFKSQCFNTLADATAAFWSETPAFMTVGTTSYLAEIMHTGAVYQIKRYTLASGGGMTLNTTTTLPAVTFPTCETAETFNDGMALGWGVAAAIVAAWVLKNLRRGL